MKAQAKKHIKKIAPKAGIERDPRDPREPGCIPQGR